MAFDLLTHKQSKRDWSCGSILLPSKEQDKIFDKIDDLRGTRRTGFATIGAIAVGAIVIIGVIVQIIIAIVSHA